MVPNLWISQSVMSYFDILSDYITEKSYCVHDVKAWRQNLLKISCARIKEDLVRTTKQRFCEYDRSVDLYWSTVSLSYQQFDNNYHLQDVIWSMEEGRSRAHGVPVVCYGFDCSFKFAFNNFIISLKSHVRTERSLKCM